MVSYLQPKEIATMKCLECGENCYINHGKIELEGVGVGKFQLHNVEFWECENCGEKILTPETWTIADNEESRLLQERLTNLPIREFVSSSEASRMLKISRQALHKHNKINRGFVYFVSIDGKRFYNKKSIELFAETGDGRFLLKDGIGTKYIIIKFPDLVYNNDEHDLPIAGSNWHLTNESHSRYGYAR